MKKITIPIALLLAAISACLVSCKDPATTQLSTVKATYGNMAHTMYSANGMYISLQTNYSNLSAAETATHDSIALTWSGSTTGAYPIGHAYSNSLSVVSGGKTYNSLNSWAHGSIEITSLDANNLIATGTFSATLYGSRHSDSLQVNQGTLSVKYAF